MAVSINDLIQAQHIGGVPEKQLEILYGKAAVRQALNGVNIDDYPEDMSEDDVVKLALTKGDDPNKAVSLYEERTKKNAEDKAREERAKAAKEEERRISAKKDSEMMGKFGDVAFSERTKRLYAEDPNSVKTILSGALDLGSLGASAAALVPTPVTTALGVGLPALNEAVSVYSGDKGALDAAKDAALNVAAIGGAKILKPKNIYDGMKSAAHFGGNLEKATKGTLEKGVEAIDKEVVKGYYIKGLSKSRKEIEGLLGKKGDLSKTSTRDIEKAISDGLITNTEEYNSEMAKAARFKIGKFKDEAKFAETNAKNSLLPELNEKLANIKSQERVLEVTKKKELFTKKGEMNAKVQREKLFPASIKAYPYATPSSTPVKAGAASYKYVAMPTFAMLPQLNEHSNSDNERIKDYQMAFNPRVQDKWLAGEIPDEDEGSREWRAYKIWLEGQKE